LAIAILVSVTILNLVLWAIMLIRFRKMFSTDKILEKARSEMNHMVSDLNSTTDRDIFLTNEASARIKMQVEEADRQMNSIIKQYNDATNRLRSMISEVDKIPAPRKEPEQVVSVNLNNTNYRNTAASDYEKAGHSLKITRVVNEPDDYVSNPFMEPQKVTIPVTPVNSFVKSAESKKSTIQKTVKNLYDEGYDIKQIAQEISCSETEVQLILEML